MNRKLYSILTVVAVSFALIAGLGAFNAVKAASYTDGLRGFNLPAGEVNFVGADLADNSVKAADRNLDLGSPKFTPDTYGVNGTLRP